MAIEIQTCVIHWNITGQNNTAQDMNSYEVIAIIIIPSFLN